MPLQPGNQLVSLLQEFELSCAPRLDCDVQIDCADSRTLDSRLHRRDLQLLSAQPRSKFFGFCRNLDRQALFLQAHRSFKARRTLRIAQSPSFAAFGALQCTHCVASTSFNAVAVSSPSTTTTTTMTTSRVRLVFLFVSSSTTTTM
jgi:hypothetical protein